MTRLSPPRTRLILLSAIVATVWLLDAACEKETPTEASSGQLDLAGKPSSGDPVVSSTDPASAPQDTTLNVAVMGSGFEAGSRVDFGIDAVPTDKVRTNSTTFVNSKKLIANITIAPDAIPDRYDVLVTTPKGKRGIGIERFEVTLRQGKTSLYTITFGGDLGGSVSNVTLDYRDPLKQINTGAVTFNPLSASGTPSACRRINGTPVTVTDWGTFSESAWVGGMDLSRRGSGSFHFQLVGDQQDADGGHINLVVNERPIIDMVDTATGIAFTEFHDARALVGLSSWAETDASGTSVADDRDRCLNFTITAAPSGTTPQ